MVTCHPIVCLVYSQTLINLTASHLEAGMLLVLGSMLFLIGTVARSRIPLRATDAKKSFSDSWLPKGAAVKKVKPLSTMKAENTRHTTANAA